MNWICFCVSEIPITRQRLSRQNQDQKCISDNTIAVFLNFSSKKPICKEHNNIIDKYYYEIIFLIYKVIYTNKLASTE